MGSDIILENDKVRVQGKIAVNGPDVEVDSADRRKNTRGFRRAMVHDFGDGLTINWDKDYPGGITMYGRTAVTDNGSNGVRIVPEAYNPNQWPKLTQNSVNPQQLDLINEIKAIKQTVIQLREGIRQIWSALLQLPPEIPISEELRSRLQGLDLGGDRLPQNQADPRNLLQPQHPVIPGNVTPRQQNQPDPKKGLNKK